MNRIRQTFFSVCSFALILSLAFASVAQKTSATKTPQAALDKITADGLMNHIKVLGSDEYEGRADGTKREELTVKYLEEQSRKAGLKPGNTDGTYIQKVPLVGITTEQDAELKIKTAA